MVFIFSAKLKFCLRFAKTIAKIANYFFKLTRFLCKGIVYTAVVVICFYDKSLPFNPLWIIEHLSGTEHKEGIIWIIIGKIVTFIYNYYFWTMVTIQAYCTISDILIGVLSLSFCQKVAHR